MFGIVRNIFVIAVLAGLWFACKPFQKWLRKRKTPWLILGTGYALLIFLCSFIVPETTLIGFDSPLAAYAYAKSSGEADYEQMIDCETSTLLITRKGTNNISTSILLKKEGNGISLHRFHFHLKKHLIMKRLYVLIALPTRNWMKPIGCCLTWMEVWEKAL